jgi:hypothetical protein
MVPCRFSFNWPIFGLETSSKGHGSNYWLSANRIALFHWTLDVRPSSNVALILHTASCNLELHYWNFLGLSSYIQPEFGLQLAAPHTGFIPVKPPGIGLFYLTLLPSWAPWGLGLLFINKTVLADGHLWCWRL